MAQHMPARMLLVGGTSDGTRKHRPSGPARERATALSGKVFLEYEHPVIFPTRFADHLNRGRWK
jgi:hypothetical protein